jgi:hypothetical protein
MSNILKSRYVPMYKWSWQRWLDYLEETISQRPPNAVLERATDKQINYLIRLQVPDFVAIKLSRGEAGRVIQRRLEEKEAYQRWLNNPHSYWRSRPHPPSPAPDTEPDTAKSTL